MWPRLPSVHHLWSHNEARRFLYLFTVCLFFFWGGGVRCQKFPCLMPWAVRKKAALEDEHTDLYGESAECKEPGVAVSQSRIYQHIKGGRRRVGFHLYHMLSFYITADRARLGRWAIKVRRDERGYRWGRGRFYGFVISCSVGRLQDSEGPAHAKHVVSAPSRCVLVWTELSQNKAPCFDFLSFSFRRCTRCYITLRCDWLLTN